MKKKNRNNDYNLVFGALFLGILAIMAILSAVYTPYDPDAMNGVEKFMAPGFKHIFGTDNFGRDIFSRICKGVGTTFFVAIMTVLIGASIGTVIGAVTGYFGGFVDEVLMRINDAVASFPSVLLALVFISILGPGKYNVILALGIIFVPSFARIVRSEFLREKNLDYVKSARLMKAGSLRIMFIHIFPNIVPVLLSSVAIGFNNAVLAEAGMSYLGIGVQPPDASLGRMLSESQTYLFTAPWLALFPGISIIVLILGFSMMGEVVLKRRGGA